jgi:hypothetical protein
MPCHAWPNHAMLVPTTGITPMVGVLASLSHTTPYTAEQRPTVPDLAWPCHTEPCPVGASGDGEATAGVLALPNHAEPRQTMPNLTKQRLAWPRTAAPC